MAGTVPFVPLDLLRHAAIPLAARLLPFWAGVERLIRILFLLLREVAVLLKVIHELPNVEPEELVAFR